MKPITFNNNTVQRVYNDYIYRCTNFLKGLPNEDKEECLMEINSYIFEYLEANKEVDQMNSLLNILERLGAPEETLKEFVASKKVKQAVKTFNPIFLVQALYLNIKNGFIYSVLSVLFLIIFTLPFLVILKLIYPKSVGCYVGEHSFYFGFIDEHANTVEILGNGFIPVVILMGLILYYAIILTLKFKNKQKKNK
jgi:uncharacterized membrane protein